MAIQLTREQLLQPIQQVMGVVERRQTVPILAMVLFEQSNGQLCITGTDLEIELKSRVTLESLEEARFTVPGRKLMDICRSLPDLAEITINHKNQRVSISSGNSRFSLQGLPAEDFLSIDEEVATLEFSIAAKQLVYLLTHAQYAMAQQDVRYYLNGMLWQIADNTLTAVAIDGHRMALAQQALPGTALPPHGIIVPRKGIAELSRLLTDLDEDVSIKFSNNHLHVIGDNLTFTSKLIDGNYPDYRLVMPKDCNNSLFMDKKLFHQALTRTSVLCNEKFRGISFELSENNLKLIATNVKQEQAEENLLVNYTGKPLSLGFNVSYLLETLNAIDGEEIKLSFSDSGGSILVEDVTDDNCEHVIMPMRL